MNPRHPETRDGYSRSHGNHRFPQSDGTGFSWPAMAGALAMAVFLFSLIPLSRVAVGARDSEVSIREVVTVPPPPPEMPPLPDEERPPDQSDAIEVEIRQPVRKVEVQRMEMDWTPGIAGLLGTGFDAGGFAVGTSLDVNVGEDIRDIFDFDDLSQPPTLLNPGQIRMTFPRELRRRGIGKVDLMVRILIDKRGRAELQEIISTTVRHDSVEREAREIVRQMRFSITEVNGRRVMVRSPLPLTLQAQ